jgi:hypothetical protein
MVRACGAATRVVVVARGKLQWHSNKYFHCCRKQVAVVNNNAMSGCCETKILPLPPVALQWLPSRLVPHTISWLSTPRHCHTTTKPARIPPPTVVHCLPHRLLLRSSSTWSTSSTDSTLLETSTPPLSAAAATNESEPQQQQRRLVMQQCQELHRSIMDLNERVRSFRSLSTITFLVDDEVWRLGIPIVSIRVVFLHTRTHALYLDSGTARSLVASGHGVATRLARGQSFVRQEFVCQLHRGSDRANGWRGTHRRLLYHFGAGKRRSRSRRARHDWRSALGLCPLATIWTHAGASYTAQNSQRLECQFHVG